MRNTLFTSINRIIVACQHFILSTSVSVFRSCAVLLLLLIFDQYGATQSHYENAWQAINNAKIEEAISLFEKAIEANDNKSKATLCLVLLYSKRNKEQLASQYYNQYLDEVEHTDPTTYALLFQEGVTGIPGNYQQHQIDLLHRLNKNKRSKLQPSAQYYLFFHYLMKQELKKAKSFSDNIKTLDEWSLVGPFDNVMNNGFDKDFGVLSSPESDAEFKSKYGAKVSWFKPATKSTDGYIFKDEHFRSSQSIIYAQTFIESPELQEVRIKVGYTGSMKIWLNDQELYAESDKRRTDIDFYTFQVPLQKGNNRLLLQLGDYNADLPSFIVRLSNTNDEHISLPLSAMYKPYENRNFDFERKKHFAVEYFEGLVAEEPKDLLNKLLLAMTYTRSFELEKAEEIYKSILDLHPNNYFALRHLILLYDEMGSNTNQSLYYSLFEKAYPNSLDILEIEVSETLDQKSKKKYADATHMYDSLYPSDEQMMRHRLGKAILDENSSLILEIADSLYDINPNEYDVFSMKYRLELNHLSNRKSATEVLEKFVRNNYNINAVTELANYYAKEGRFDDAVNLFRNRFDYYPTDFQGHRYIVNLLTKQKKYKKALAECQEILNSKPSDYLVLKDMALLSKYLNDEKSALAYYQKSNEFYPFSYDLNEKIRGLKGLKLTKDYIDEIDPVELIRAYQALPKASIIKPYDVVLEQETNVLFKSGAQGYMYSYILRMNDESAIEEWQRVSLNSGDNFNIEVQEASTFKNNGEEISAERTGSNIVFTNLEIGDFIYVSYFQEQVSGGKTSLFFDDNFAFNTYNPTYKLEFNLLLEDGVPFRDTVVLGNIKPTINAFDGFKHYKWTRVSPKVLKSESYAPAFSDLAEQIHVTNTTSWNEIVQWYSDLSANQAKPDLTIERIAKELFEGKDLTSDQKFKLIYEFVCKNIQYSSLDFRQSGYIPQKASTVYHSRLGDCKDVSTLFVSIARAAGLKAHLVLISTGNNGKNSVVLPSLNFNHCIVKAYGEKQISFLELTDPTLPYGHLYYYHKNSPILEIPYHTSSSNATLEYLELNPGFTSSVIRNTNIKIGLENDIQGTVSTVVTGTNTANIVDSYHYKDAVERQERIKSRIAPRFQSYVSIDTIYFEHLSPLDDTATYTYIYNAQNELIKLGSFKSLKIPFSDLTFDLGIFDDGKRNYQFEYNYYENSEFYEETIILELKDGLELVEVPDDINLKFKSNEFDLTFTKQSANLLSINRIFKTQRAPVSVSDYSDFKEFMTKINEAENTHLLFK